MAGAWIVSFNVTWILAAIGVWQLFAPAEAKEELAAHLVGATDDFVEPHRVLVAHRRAGKTVATVFDLLTCALAKW